MNYRILLLSFLVVPAVNFAQVIPDSLNIQKRLFLNNDFSAQKISTIPDSIRSFTRMDSIRNQFNLSVDSLQKQYQKTIANLHFRTNKLKHTIDSLQKLKLASEKYRGSLNSLSNLHQKAESQFSDKLTALKSKYMDKIKTFDLPPRVQRTPPTSYTRN